MDKLSMWNPFNWGEIMVEGAQSKIVSIFTELMNDFISASFDICLIAGIIGLTLYLFGCKKAKSIPTLAPVIYIIIRILGGAILGV